MKKIGTTAAVMVASGVLATSPAVSAGAAGQGDVQRQLAEVRRATAMYHDVDRAVAAGYTPTSHCVPGMGYHYVNFDLFGEETDPLKPVALIYAPTKGEHLRLVAVEYFEIDADQDLETHNNPRPSLFGRDFDGPMEGHGGEMPHHYDLHAWIWAHNPNGPLEPVNPKIQCPEH